ncbi:13512_t:CDS:2 [Rhizophagus irregularis]|nr:13512_t:CDS:2 [Rhizophagus irregularis]
MKKLQYHKISGIQNRKRERIYKEINVSFIGLPRTPRESKEIFDKFINIERNSETTQRSFCKHLNLIVIERIINTIIDKKYGIPIVESVILNLFIKENRKFTHLYIPHRFDHQIHLIPDAKCCFLELQFLCCHTTIDDNILNGLTEICKSIKELELFIGWTNNKYGIIKLIENQKELSDIRLNYYYSSNNESFFKILITSLIKFSNNIQYFTSKSLSLPFFQVFGAVEISAKSLTSLIENTSGNLIEIKIGDTAYNGFFNKRIIQAIYLNCPNLRYLKLFVENNNILEFEKLLINCKYLNGLFILFDNQKIFDNQDNRIYKAKGIIKRYDNEAYYEDFEWIKKKV